MDRNRWLMFIVVVAVIFGGLVVWQRVEQANLPKSEGSANYYGKEDSKVTLTEYVDFQCEACYAYYPTIKEVKEKYKDKVRFQIRNFPISSSHKHARLAAGYAQAAAMQGKFFEMHDKIFEGQKSWEASSEPEEVFDGYAKEIGLDMKKLGADRQSTLTKAVINADIEAVKKLSGTGTPTFVLNGKLLKETENDVEAFSKIIDEALTEVGSE